MIRASHLFSRARITIEILRDLSKVDQSLKVNIPSLMAGGKADRGLLILNGRLDLEIILAVLSSAGLNSENPLDILQPKAMRGLINWRKAIKEVSQLGHRVYGVIGDIDSEENIERIFDNNQSYLQSPYEFTDPDRKIFLAFNGVPSDKRFSQFEMEQNIIRCFERVPKYAPVVKELLRSGPVDPKIALRNFQEKYERDGNLKQKVGGRPLELHQALMYFIVKNQECRSEFQHLYDLVKKVIA
ncbi:MULTISPECIES: hypothetical protein [Metallosphaera]|uniref:hypothetical protein n=1 Tax=Metallosphaera TaxID=41980 RepID=UPI000B16AA65|nr:MULTISPECIES: hypothetical protein [Metallosphaera]MCY0862962.1 hypothetical protein [Metallosphaera prunae]WPX07290.1 hypothetical protein SOJ17_001052 [Metallosphaera sedula DSM 5348]